MNSAFAGAVAAMRRAPETLTHSQSVARLYRHSLKCMMSWTVDRGTINAHAAEIRSQFDENAHLSEREGKTLLKEGEALLFDHTHPDPYVFPYLPGGSKFMRNPPPPLEAIYPDGVPAEVEAATDRVHVDMVPVSIRPAPENIIVDAMKKNHE